MSGPARVLVVDDEPSARATLEAILGDEFEVRSEGTLLAARNALAAGSYDVLVTDFDMPGGTGLGLLRHLSEAHPLTIGVLVTGHPDHPEVRAAKAHWEDFAVMLKPYDPALLIGCVRNAAGIARLRQATQRLAGRGATRDRRR